MISFLQPQSSSTYNNSCDMSKEAEEFKSSLCDLTFNSKPLISCLTMLAEEYITAAPSIVAVVEDHIKQVKGEKLPTLYLIDSIVKTVGKDYVTLFSNNLPQIFSSVFYQSGDKVRMQMFKLRHTWNEVFHPNKLYTLDLQVHKIDPKWPVIPLPSTTCVHVNPLFMKTMNTTVVRPVPVPNDGMMREKILKEKKELLELEKRKVELQLLQTKEVLEQEQRKLESYAMSYDIPGKSSIKIDPPSMSKSDDKYLKLLENPQATSTKDSVSNGSKNSDSRSTSLTHKKSLYMSRDPRVKRKQGILDEKSVSSSNQETKKSKSSKSKRSRSEIDSSKEVNPAKKSKKHSDVTKDNSKKSFHKNSSKSSKSSSHREKDIKMDIDVSEECSDNKEPVLVVEPTVSKSTLKQVVDEIKDDENILSNVDVSGNQPLVSKPPDEETNQASSPSKAAKMTKKPANSDNLDGNVNLLPKELEKILEEKVPSPKLSTSSIIVSSIMGSSSISTTTVSSSSHSTSPKKVVASEPLISSFPAPDINVSLIATPEVPVASPSVTPLPTEEPGKDTDLRLLLNPVKPVSSDPPDEGATDGLKQDKIIKLFGEEDVDLRKSVPSELPVSLPSPPSPPMLGSRKSDQPDPGKSWAQLKSSDRRESERPSPKYPRNKPDRLGRPPLSYSPYTSEEKESDPSSSPPRSRSNYHFIIKDAEEQFRSGNIDFVQYNALLNEAMLNEDRKIRDSAHYRQTHYPREEHPPLQYSEAPVMPSPQMDMQPYHGPDPHYRHPGENRPSFMPPHHPMDMDGGYHKQPPPRRHFDNVGYYDWLDRGGPGPRGNMMERGGRGSFCRPVPPPNMNNMNHQAPPLLRNPGFPYYNNPRRMNVRLPLPSPSSYRPHRMDRPVVSHRSSFGLRTHIPLVDRNLLAEAEKDVSDVVTIGDTRQIRFYGDIGIVMMGKDDPREVGFQPGARHIIIDHQHEFLLKFGAPPIEISIDGYSSFVRLGVPTRELYVDDMYYPIGFGKSPVDLIICGRTRSVMLEGPSPIVRYGQVRRLDLVAGKVELVVDAKSSFSIFLDGRPQKFEIAGEPCVLKFADALTTVLLNGAPVNIEFGGAPVPIVFKGREHFIRLSFLPKDIVPGRVCIKDMESFTKYPPPPIPPTPSMHPPPMSVHQPYSNPAMGPGPECMRSSNVPQQVDMIANVAVPPPFLPTPGGSSYYIDPPQPEPVQQSVAPPSQPQTLEPSINLGELLKKLEFIGLVPSKSSSEPDTKNTTFVSDVDLSRPETLKVRQPGLIAQLYSGSQCSSCGIRFPPEGTKMYSRHLDWHFRQNRKEKASTKIPHSRNWYYDMSDIIQYQEVEDIDDNIDPNELLEDDDAKKENSSDELFEDAPSVPVGELKDAKCAVCCDQFDEFYNHEKDEWHLKNAIIIEDSLFHPICYEEFKVQKELPAETELPLIEEEEEEKLFQEKPESVEIIELDDTIDTHTPSQKSDESGPATGGEASKSLDVSNDDIQVDLTCDEDVNECEQEPESTDKMDSLVPSDAASNKEVSSEDVKLENDSDDDILQIEVIERKIELYELLDDEEEGKTSKEQTPVKEAPSEVVEEHSEPPEVVIGSGSDDEPEINVANVVIKQEKDAFPETTVDSSVPTYTTTIDGNIIHEKTAPVLVPSKIKINITSVKSSSEGTASPTSSCSSGSEVVVPPQPPPPGEENVVVMKPCFDGVDLTDNPPVNKGNELSGLCSIM